MKVKQIFSDMRDRLNTYYATSAKEYLDDSILRETFWIANERNDFMRQIMKRVRLKHFEAGAEERTERWMP